MNSLGYLVVLPPRQPPIKTDKCLMDVESPLSPSFWLPNCFMSRFPMKDWSLRSFISRGCWRKGGYIKASINASKFPNFLPSVQQADMNHYFQTLPIMYSCKSESRTLQSKNDMHGLQQDWRTAWHPPRFASACHYFAIIVWPWRQCR